MPPGRLWMFERASLSAKRSRTEWSALLGPLELLDGRAATRAASSQAQTGSFFPSFPYP
jgi:hypothetical protein